MRSEFPTVRSLIYWEYAKLIAGEAVGERSAYRFVNFTYQRLLNRRISPSAILEENKRLLEAGDACAYCGAVDQPQWEHIIPRTANGPESIDNLVRACRTCNAAKAARDPYQWYASLGKIDEIPRMVLGKLLKLVFAEYERRGLLDDEAFMHSQGVTRNTLLISQ